MILRRIADALKRQDWFVVALEVLVVVIGILIGLQLDDWNEMRKHRNEERTYLELLRADAATMQAALSGRLGGPNGTEDRLRRMIAALRALEACDEGPQAVADIKYALERYQVTPPFGYRGATYNEMVATGSLARIDDVRLKHAIAYSFSELESIDRRVGAFRISIPIVDEIVWQKVSYGNPEGERGRVSASFEVATLCGDRQLRNAVGEMIDIQADVLTTQTRALDSLEELMQVLDAKTDPRSAR